MCACVGVCVRGGVYVCACVRTYVRAYVCVCAHARVRARVCVLPNLWRLVPGKFTGNVAEVLSFPAFQC